MTRFPARHDVGLRSQQAGSIHGLGGRWGGASGGLLSRREPCYECATASPRLPLGPEVAPNANTSNLPVCHQYARFFSAHLGLTQIRELI